MKVYTDTKSIHLTFKKRQKNYCRIKSNYYICIISIGIVEVMSSNTDTFGSLNTFKASAKLITAGAFLFNMNTFKKIQTAEHLTQFIDVSKIIGIKSEHHNYQQEYGINEKSRKYYVILLDGCESIRIDEKYVFELVDILERF